jgi:hypothetical protein
VKHKFRSNAFIEFYAAATMGGEMSETHDQFCLTCPASIVGGVAKINFVSVTLYATSTHSTLGL